MLSGIVHWMRRHGRLLALAVAIAFTGMALVQQATYAFGLVHGSPVAALRGSPLPLLLVAAPAWALAARQVVPSGRMRRAAAAAARFPVGLGVLVVLCGTVALWAALQGALPYIGHDEGVYATKARSWATGAPVSTFFPYRPIVLPMLGSVALTVQDSLLAVRLVGLGLALATLGITYVVAARLTTPRRAVIVIAIVASGWGFLRRLPEFLNDIGAAGLLLAVAFLMVRARQRPESNHLAGAAAVAVAAFYLRYGAVSALLALAAAALVAWGPRAWLASWRQLTVAAAVLVAGLLPHLLYSQHVAGSPLAVMLSAGDVAGREYVGDGLVYYALVFPFRLTGDLGGVVMGAGLIAAALAASRLRRKGLEREGDRIRVFFGLAAILHVVLLGLTAHGEERFVFFPVLLLTILGVEALAELSRESTRVVLAVLASYAVLAAGANLAVVRDGSLTDVTAERGSIVAVGDFIARQPPETRPCVVATSYEPEVGWYSGCATFALKEVPQAKPADVQAMYIVLFERDRHHPRAAEFSRWADRGATETIVLDAEDSRGAARIITLR